MKVHQITEAPRIEPTLGNSRGTVTSGPKLSATSTSSLPKSVDIKPGILDSKGNKTFNVVDQDGKVIKRFTGPSAEADANTHRDNLKKQIKAAKPAKTQPKLTGDPKKDLTQPDTDKSKDTKPKGKFTDKFKMGVKGGGFLGLIVGAGLLGERIIEVGNDYAKALDDHNGNTKHPEVKKARAYLANICANAFVQLFTGIASGAVAAGVATKLLGAIPFAGWIAAIIGSAGAIIIQYVALKAAEDGAYIESLAAWLMARIDDELLANLMDDTNVESGKGKVKNAMIDLIKSDPKIMQAYKLAKKSKATKAAA